jgi:hypothetical protein
VLRLLNRSAHDVGDGRRPQARTGRRGGAEHAQQEIARALGALRFARDAVRLPGDDAETGQDRQQQRRGHRDASTMTASELARTVQARRRMRTHRLS